MAELRAFGYGPLGPARFCFVFVPMVLPWAFEFAAFSRVSWFTSIGHLHWPSQWHTTALTPSGSAVDHGMQTGGVAAGY
jgi:hypothetical protein